MVEAQKSKADFTSRKEKGHNEISDQIVVDHVGRTSQLVLNDVDNTKAVKETLAKKLEFKRSDAIKISKESKQNQIKKPSLHILDEDCDPVATCKYFNF